ncbi:MAG: type IV pilus twitching motility protein PilT, partial [Vulcanimicrobiota bacterium]
MPKKVDKYLVELMNASGSDLHLPSASPPMIRVHGSLERTNNPPFTSEQVREMALEILSQEEQEILFEETNVDFVYEMDDPSAKMTRFRTNIFFQKNGLNIVFRGIPQKIPTLRDLGLPETLVKMIKHHQGMILVTGPSGCGKTATLAALINLINERYSHHIITVEEPIEYVHESKCSLIVQREVKKDVDRFSTALKASLREDPDIIMVGEMRDLETIQMAITAAETGHLVFATLHTNGAISTINRIIDAFPLDQQSQIRTMFSESLKGVVSQQLIPRLDGKGRIVACEVLHTNSSISNLIRDNKTLQIFSM